jgi:hypothetical protein
LQKSDHHGDHKLRIIFSHSSQFVCLTHGWRTTLARLLLHYPSTNICEWHRYVMHRPCTTNTCTFNIRVPSYIHKKRVQFISWQDHTELLQIQYSTVAGCATWVWLYMKYVWVKWAKWGCYIPKLLFVCILLPQIWFFSVVVVQKCCNFLYHKSDLCSAINLERLTTRSHDIPQFIP